MIEFCIVFHIIRDIYDGDVLAFFIVVDVCLHLKQIDDTLETVLAPDRQLETDRILAQSCPDLVYRIIEIRTQDVHLVDKCHTGYIVGVSLTPYIL